LGCIAGFGFEAQHPRQLPQQLALGGEGRAGRFGSGAGIAPFPSVGEGAQGFGQLKQHRQRGCGVEVVVHGGGEAVAGGGEFRGQMIGWGEGWGWGGGCGGGGSGSTVDVPLPTTGLTAGDVCYVSGNNTLTAANATAVGTANALGIVVVVGGAGTGTVRTQGIYANANFVSGLTLVAGQTAYLSKTAGKLTNDVSAYTTGNVYMPVGIITNVTTAGGGNGAADVAINPDLLIVV
jgi:hypothetical protein